MKGLVVYNSFLGKQNKFFSLVQDLKKEGHALGIDLELRGNGEILNTSFIKLDYDFVIFWDKDIALARNLELQGLPVYNCSEAIRICDSKIETFLKLKDKLPMPKTVVGPFSYFDRSFEDAYLDEVIDYLGEKIVIKEEKGSFGMQVYLALGKEDLKDTLQGLGNKNFIMQEFVEESSGRDLRINIVGDRVIGAMERTNKNDFRANISSGGKGCFVEPSQAEKDLALAAQKIMGLSFSGVDILYGKDGPLFCEINSNVNYLSFNHISGLSMGREILTYIRRINERD